MDDLSADKLLAKCVDGKTQNQNECFNNYVWRRIPKDVFAGKNTFHFGMYDAVAVFNIGRLAILKVYNRVGISPGHFTSVGCKSQNQRRLYNAKYKNSSKRIKARKVQRGAKKKKDDKFHILKKPFMSLVDFSFYIYIFSNYHFC